MAHGLDTVKKSLARGTELLGHMMWWTLDECTTTISDFTKVWKDAGLDEKWLPEGAGPARALRAAGKAVTKEGTGFIFRPAAETPSHVILAICREDKDGKGNNSYTQEAQVAVDGAGTFSTDNVNHKMVAMIHAEFNRLWGVYVAQDITRAITNALGANAAVLLRKTGGVYYVPNTGTDAPARLQAAIQKVGRSEATVIPVFSDAAGTAQQQIGSAAKGSIEAELQDLAAEMDQFIEGVLNDQPSPTIEHVMNRRLQTFDELRAKAVLFRDILAVEVKDLNEKLDILEEQARTIIGAVNP
jgi:DNA-directed RNA polymerase beta subunit